MASIRCVEPGLITVSPAPGSGFIPPFCAKTAWRCPATDMNQDLGQGEYRLRCMGGLLHVVETVLACWTLTGKAASRFQQPVQRNVNYVTRPVSVSTRSKVADHDVVFCTPPDLHRIFAASQSRDERRPLGRRRCACKPGKR